MSDTSSQNSDFESDHTALDSTLTLANSPCPRIFVFNPNSMINATIYSCARPVYDIRSNDTLSRTDLFDLAEQKVVASIKRRLFADVVEFAHRDNKTIRINQWLKRRKAPAGQTLYSSYVNLQTLGGTFIWRSERAVSHHFALYFEGQDDSPIAYSILNPPTMDLVLDPGLDNDVLVVEIITSFLVLENRFRMDNKADRELIHAVLRGFNMIG